MDNLSVDQTLRQAEGLAQQGQINKARRLLQAILDAVPGEDRARKALASLGGRGPSAPVTQDPPQEILENLVALFNQGQLEIVVGKAEELAGQYPDAFILWNILGVSSAQTQQLEIAERAFRRAVELSQGHPEPLNNLGNVLRERGKLDEAVAAYQSALTMKPDYIVALNNLGVAHQSQGHFEEAITAYRKALSLRPDFAEAQNALGVALQSQGKLDEAAKAFQQAFTTAPDYLDALNNFANVLKEQDKLEEAVTAYRRVLEIDPDYPKAHNNLGIVFRILDRLDEAIACYKRALDLDPNYTTALDSLGNALQERGDFDGARAAYNDLLKIQPGNAEAFRALSQVKKFADGDPDLKRMLDLNASETLNDVGRCHLEFALAKAEEDIGNTEQAFLHLKSGNALRKANLGYNFSTDEALFTAIRSTDERIRQHCLSEGPEPLGTVPIFIVGMPRSGTTLAEQIVSAHPDVAGAGELKFAGSFGSTISSGKKSPSRDLLKDFRERYLAAIAPKAGNAPFVTDKMPQNFLHVGLICSALPEARIVHVKRDPAATCWSNFQHYFADDSIGFNYDLDDVIRYYRHYEALMDFWADRYADRIYLLDYEALTTDQEIRTRDLISALGLPWDEACLSPHRNLRGIKTASQQQVRQPVYAGSSQKWRKFEPFLNGAFDELTA